jgi:hypothetical protein
MELEEVKCTIKVALTHGDSKYRTNVNLSSSKFTRFHNFSASFKRSNNINQTV